MPEFKGTPWKALSAPTDNVTVIWDNNDDRIAIVEEFPSGRSAKLIAAAPELLDALKEAITELEQYIPVTDVTVLDKAYAAINKALGGTNNA